MTTKAEAKTVLDLRRRPRRLRRSAAIRALVRETRLSPDNFLYPLFVRSGEGERREIASMPGVFQMSVDEIVKEAAAAKADGIPGVLLFGLPDSKDSAGSAAYDPEAPVQSAVRALKRAVPDLLVVTDVCLCEYTSHGHCGILIDDEVDNDATVTELVRAALSHAAAGADIVAPSDMMDGRIGRIREALDTRGFNQTAILSYAAKYCSAFYGPFREAADSAPAFGDRRSHQMDPANADEALREVQLDIDEGADIVMTTAPTASSSLPYCCLSCLAIVLSSALAVVNEVPRFSLAMPSQLCDVRPLVSANSSLGIHRSAFDGYAKPSGITPTTRAV